MNNYRYGSYLDRFRHLYPNEEIIENDFEPDKYVLYLIEPENDLNKFEIKDHADPYLMEKVDTFLRELFQQKTKCEVLNYREQQATRSDTSLSPNDTQNELYFLSRRNESTGEEERTHSNKSNNGVSTLIDPSSSDDADCYCAPYCMMLENDRRSSRNLHDNQTAEDMYKYETDSQYSRESPGELYEGLIANTGDERYHIIDDEDDGDGNDNNNDDDNNDDDDNLMIDEGNATS